MNSYPINILLADDDADDRFFFKDVLDEIPIPTSLVTVYDGVALMELLFSTKQLPDVLFLDLNMPRKNGFECLTEIKQDGRLKALTVIVYSTSYDEDIVNTLHQSGANYYIRKPAEFPALKKIVHHSLLLVSEKRDLITPQQKFVLWLD